MADLARLGFKIDSSGLRGANKELDNLSRSAKKAETTTTKATKNMESGFSSVKSAVVSLGATVAASLSVREITRYSDAFTGISNRLKIVTKDEADLISVREKLLAVSNETRNSFESTASLYATLGRNSEQLGLSQERLLRITESINKSFAISGASAQEVSGAIRQLSQGLASGALRGDEFNSVAEQAPEILRAVSKETGLAIGALREFAADGGITAEILIRAIENYGSTVDAIFAKSTATISQSLEVAQNNLISFIGGAEGVQSASASAGGAIVSLSENLDDLVAIAGVAASIYAGRFAGSITASTVALTRNAAAALGTTASISSLNARMGMTAPAITAASIATNAFTGSVTLANRALSLMGGPVGILIAVAGSVWALSSAFDDGLQPLGDYAEELANITGKAQKLEELQIQKRIREINEEIASLRETQSDGGLFGMPLSGDEWTDVQLKINDANRLLNEYNKQLSSVRSTAKEAKDSIQAKSETVKQAASLITELTSADKFYMDQLMETYEAEDKVREGYRETMASLADQKYMLTLNAKELFIYKKQAELGADATKEMRDAVADSAAELYEMNKAAEDSARAAEGFETAWKRSVERVDDLFQDLWGSVFDGFEDFGDKLKSSFKNILAEMAHAAITRPIVLSITGGGMFGMAGTAGAGNAASAGMQGVGLLDSIKLGISTLNGNITESIAKIGIGIGNIGNWEGITGTIGELVTSNAEMIANIAPYAGAALKLLQGDFKGAAFQGAGVAIGSLIGGPIGGAIGGFLGNVVGGLFGGSKPKMKGDTATYSRGGESSTSSFGRSLGGGDALKALNEYVGTRLDTLLEAFDSNMQYSLFSIFRTRTNARAGFRINGNQLIGGKYNNGGFEQFQSEVLNNGVSAAIQTLSGIPQSIKQLFSGLSGQSLVDPMISAVVRLTESQEELNDVYGLTVSQAASVALATGKTKEELTAMVEALSTAAAGSRTVGKQILIYKANLEEAFGGELPQTLSEYDSALKAINKTTADGIQEFAMLFDMRDSFSEFTSALDELKGNVATSIYELLPAGEKFSRTMAATELLFANLGVEVPQSVSELIKLGESIDYTTEEGINLAAAFPSLVKAFQETRGQADALTDSLNKLDPSRFSDVVSYRRAASLTRNGIPAFASGGTHAGGLRLVGENGPEIESTGPSKIFNQDQLINLAPLMNQFAQLQQQVSMMRGDTQEINRSTRSTNDIIQRVSRDGQSFLTESVA